MAQEEGTGQLLRDVFSREMEVLLMNAERYYYRHGKHPPACTCVTCEENRNSKKRRRPKASGGENTTAAYRNADRRNHDQRTTRSESTAARAGSSNFLDPASGPGGSVHSGLTGASPSDTDFGDVPGAMERLEAAHRQVSGDLDNGRDTRTRDKKRPSGRRARRCCLLGQEVCLGCGVD